jgi:hypothetical protein
MCDLTARKWELDDGKPPAEGTTDKTKDSEQQQERPKAGKGVPAAAAAGGGGAAAGAGKGRKSAAGVTPAGKGDEKAAGQALVGHVIEFWDAPRKAYVKGTVQVGGQPCVCLCVWGGGCVLLITLVRCRGF